MNSHLNDINIMEASNNATELAQIMKKDETNGDNGVEEYLEPRFECPICLTWLRDPILTSCGHKFCSQCIYAWLKKEGACCPLDSQPLKSDSDLFRDLYTKREISQKLTTCLYQRFGCQVELSPMNMEKHIGQCIYRRNLLESQVSNITNAMSAESKLWDPPPKNEAQISNMKEPTPDWQELLKNLYERIVVLEQENRELSITVSNQKNQLAATCLRNCNGVYIWRLKSFQEKLTAMIKDPLKMFYSPGFYTSPNGYKICARINISSKNSDYLSLLLHIMKSENDDALDWPFNGTIYFVLVHPQDSEKNIREVTSSIPDLEAFQKPTCELNKRSFGYTEFVCIRDVTNFLQHDSLIFRIVVRAHDDKFKRSLKSRTDLQQNVVANAVANKTACTVDDVTNAVANVTAYHWADASRVGFSPTHQRNDRGEPVQVSTGNGSPRRSSRDSSCAII